MERGVLGRSIFVPVVLVATIALTGESSFSETTECRAGPGAPSPQGMHWYYRVDRTNNRHCWYLQAAGIQVRSHENVSISKPRPQIVTEQPLASSEQDNFLTSSSQLATAESVLTEPHDPPVGESAATRFTARWLDLPASVDLSVDKFDTPRSDYIAELASSDSEQPMLLLAPDAAGKLPQKSTDAEHFRSIFIAGAIGIVLFGAVFKLSRVLYSARPRLKSELAGGCEISLSELMRRVDETFKARETRYHPPANLHKRIADQRASKPDHLDRRAHSAPPRLSRDHATV